MAAHALLSPSNMERIMVCPGSVGLSIGLPDSNSPFAQEGTNYHDLAKICLDNGADALQYVGQSFEDETEVTEDNAEYLQKYINLVRELAAQGGTLCVEERVPISSITGEKDAEGTADCLIIREDEVVVVDLKFGRGVAVKAEGNKQLRMYAAGAIEKHGLWDAVKSVRLIICQPRVADGVSEESIDIQELRMFKDEVGMSCRSILRALDAKTHLPLHPTEKGCKFCKAAGICPALQKTVEAATEEGFEDLDKEIAVQTEKGPVMIPASDRLGRAMELADLAEIYIKGVRSAVEAELFAGRAVTGFKLVAGRKGQRKWTNKETVEEWMKNKRVKHEEMYDYTLISPTSAEKKWKTKKAKWWKELSSEYVVQKDGEPTIAKADDPRPAHVVAKAEDQFEDESYQEFL